MPQHFHNFDLSNFWNPYEWSTMYCTDVYPTDEMIGMVERELGYKLPASYIELLRIQNGGIPFFSIIASQGRFLRIEQFMSIGNTTDLSLLGQFGQRHWTYHLDFPLIGVYFATTPSADQVLCLFCLDYRLCGRDGEPQVVHVDQERDFEITILAPDFETFVRNLQEAE